MRTATMTYPSLARRVLALAPSCGLVRVVAIDGPSGAGKSTFAAHLAKVLGAPVIGSDEFLVPWDGIPLAWWPEADRQVLSPLASGRPGRYRRYDWRHAAYGDWIDVPVSPALVLEGVGAAWERSPATLRVWLDAPADVRRLRVLEREDADVEPALDEWEINEAAHFAADLTRERADLLADGAPAIPYEPELEFVISDPARPPGLIGAAP